jgi:hypothetical protein
MGSRNDYTAADVAHQNSLDRVTQLLCGLCDTIERGGNGKKALLANPNLRARWESHKETDRKEKDAYCVRGSQVRSSRRCALAKLTADERAALGVKA